MNRNEALVQLLAKSGKTQLEISRLANVTPGQIQNWKNFKNNIRPDSLEKVADACGFKVIYNTLDDLKLEPLQLNLSEEVDPMSQNTTNQIIQVFIDDNKDLKSTIKSKDKEISKLRSIIESKDKLISKTSQHIPPLEPGRYQCHTKMVLGIPSDANPKEHVEAGNVFINATFLYAELLGYKDNFELINKPFLEVLHPDEFERIAKSDPKDLYSSPEQLHGIYIYLKLKKKDGSPVFVKSHSTAVEFDGGFLVSSDLIPISEEEYISNVIDNFDTGVIGEG
tara:strand:- start:225 stop:1067 length:843 start_codon:yes stop_codon:yes gene_type:complete